MKNYKIINRELRDSLEEEKRNNEVKNKEFQHKIKMLEKDIELGNIELKKYKTEDNKEFIYKIEELEKNIRESNSNKFEFDAKKLEKEVEVLNKELELKNKLVESLSELPNIKRMIDNVAKLRVPAIDEMEKIFKILDSSKATDIITELNNVKSKIEETNERLRYQQFRQY